MKISKYLGTLGLGVILGVTGIGVYHDYPMYKQGRELQKEADKYRSHWYNYLNFPKGMQLYNQAKNLRNKIKEDSIFLKYFIDK